jgi:hypothetical protein
VPQFVEHNITVNSAAGSLCNGTDANPCFNGPSVVTVYKEQTGLYPRYNFNKVTREYEPVYGGIPQMANMTAHLALWAEQVVSILPNTDVSPVVGLDWESWEPWWDGNNARPMASPGQDIFQNKSIDRVRVAHPLWTDKQVLAQAKKEFNDAAQGFWTRTFELAKRLRPNALWSNYNVGNCAAHGCDDAEYYPWQAMMEKRKLRPKSNPPLPSSQPAPVCSTPNDNDSELSWLWKLVDVLEPVIYLSTQNATFNQRYLDCKLGEARRVSRLARPMRDGRRMPIYAYAWYDWNAECSRSLDPDCGEPTSQYLNQSALDTIFLRAALKHGIDGVFMWGGAFRDCAQAFECHGPGTCAGGHCERETSLGTYINTLLGPAVQRAVTAATTCSDSRCGGNGRCFGCPEPFDALASFSRCQCDCEDGYSNCTQAVN